jgi:hypothetical protein
MVKMKSAGTNVHSGGSSAQNEPTSWLSRAVAKAGRRRGPEPVNSHGAKGISSSSLYLPSGRSAPMPKPPTTAPHDQAEPGEDQQFDRDGGGSRAGAQGAEGDGVDW